jgi:hypothetical protein
VKKRADFIYVLLEKPRLKERLENEAGSYHLTATHVLMSTAAWQLPAGCRRISCGSFQSLRQAAVFGSHVVRRNCSLETAVQSDLL